MSEKVFNEQWMKAVMNGKESSDDFSGSAPAIDWVQYNKGFKKKLTFKLMPANTREDNVFSSIVATHWIKIGDKNNRFVCPEETVHLKGAHIKCPICEAKRKLLAMGFKEEELCEQGKFGPIPVFDPKMTSNCKVVVLSSDTKTDWDRAHISILQQNGTYLTTWLAQKYADTTMPNFTDIESSNPIVFSRPTDSGKWEREFSFQAWAPTPEVVAKLKEDNEQLTLPDLWKMPSDTDFMQMRQIMEDMVNQYVEAKKAMHPTQPETKIVEQVSMTPAQPAPQQATVAYSTNPAQFGTMNTQQTTSVAEDIPYTGYVAPTAQPAPSVVTNSGLQASSADPFSSAGSVNQTDDWTDIPF